MNSQTGSKELKFHRKDGRKVSYNSRIKWAENDYFRLDEDFESLEEGIICANCRYRITDGQGYILVLTGAQLIDHMIVEAGSLFIPHVLARITFLKPERKNDADFSN